MLHLRIACQISIFPSLLSMGELQSSSRNAGLYTKSNNVLTLAHKSTTQLQLLNRYDIGCNFSCYSKKTMKSLYKGLVSKGTCDGAHFPTVYFSFS